MKGRFGFDYGRHRDRLTQAADPARRCGEDAGSASRSGAMDQVFREASLGRGAGSGGARASRDLRDALGPQALAGFGSAKG